MMLQTIGKVVPATLLSMSRQGLFYLPLVFVLPFLFKENGIVLLQPIADLFSFMLALVLAILEVKSLNKLIKEKEATE